MLPTCIFDYGYSKFQEDSSGKGACSNKFYDHILYVEESFTSSPKPAMIAIALYLINAVATLSHPHNKNTLQHIISCSTSGTWLPPFYYNALCSPKTYKPSTQAPFLTAPAPYMSSRCCFTCTTIDFIIADTIFNPKTIWVKQYHCPLKSTIWDGHSVFTMHTCK